MATLNLLLPVTKLTFLSFFFFSCRIWDSRERRSMTFCTRTPLSSTSWTPFHMSCCSVSLGTCSVQNGYGVLNIACYVHELWNGVFKTFKLINRTRTGEAACPHLLAMPKCVRHISCHAVGTTVNCQFLLWQIQKHVKSYCGVGVSPWA